MPFSSSSHCTSYLVTVKASPVDVTWPPYIAAIPGSDGTSLYVFAAQLGISVDESQLSVEVETTSHKGSHTLRYNPGENIYDASFDGVFYPETALAEGRMAVTLTLGPDNEMTANTAFLRTFVPQRQSVDAMSQDGMVTLHLEPHSLPADGYILIVPTIAAPRPLPPNQQLIGQPYFIAASGSVTATLIPALLTIRCDPADLDGADPSNLHIWAWDRSTGSWIDLGGAYSSRDHSVTVMAQHVNTHTYALMAPPALSPRNYLPVVMRGNASSRSQ